MKGNPKSVKSAHTKEDQPVRDILLEELQKEMPITKMDSLDGAYPMLMLKTQWPFNQSISTMFKVDNSIDGTLAAKVSLGHMGWTNVMCELFRHEQKALDNRAALKVAEAMVLQYPQSEDFYNYASNRNNILKNYSEAAFYYKKLFMLDNKFQIAQFIS